MGSAKQPEPVKLVVSLLTGHPELWDLTLGDLPAEWGPTDWISESIPFDHTDYYADEMGAVLQRRFATFERLVDPGELPETKRITNKIEGSYATRKRRPINLDPGYVSLSKLVLATTKNHSHRIYLAQGIYAEVTLAYRGGRFQPWPWTYPDYASEAYLELFKGIRERYLTQLRAS
jgi:hypothetical protein